MVWLQSESRGLRTRGPVVPVLVQGQEKTGGSVQTGRQDAKVGNSSSLCVSLFRPSVDGVRPTHGRAGSCNWVPRFKRWRHLGSPSQTHLCLIWAPLGPSGWHRELIIAGRLCWSWRERRFRASLWEPPLGSVAAHKARPASPPTPKRRPPWVYFAAFLLVVLPNLLQFLERGLYFHCFSSIAVVPLSCPTTPHESSFRTSFTSRPRPPHLLPSLTVTHDLPCVSMVVCTQYCSSVLMTCVHAWLIK